MQCLVKYNLLKTKSINFIGKIIIKFFEWEIMPAVNNV